LKFFEFSLSSLSSKKQKTPYEKRRRKEKKQQNLAPNPHNKEQWSFNPLLNQARIEKKRDKVTERVTT